MSEPDDADRIYRDLIDRMVHACRRGQGQIAARRALAGAWNPNATRDALPEQHAANELLARLSPDDRRVFAALLSQQFVSGVHQVLVLLHEAGLPPFDKAYEGTPFHDFVGRLDDWEWPASGSRS